MIGADPRGQGGIAAVASLLEQSGLFASCNIRYLASHSTGGRRKKLLIAMRAWFTFVASILMGRVGLLHVHMASRASFWRKFAFIAVAYCARVPVVIHLHGGEFHVFYGAESSRVVRRVIRGVFERADKVVVLSAWWQEWVKSTFSRANVVTLYNPAPLPVRSIDPRDCATLLFLGRIGKAKGVFDLLEAISRLADRYPQVKLLLCGDGDLAEAQAVSTRLGINARVAFMGWVQGAAKATLLRTATVFVLPSYNEGLPMSVLEAMSYGMPIIASRVGGVPEAIDNEMDGLLIKPGDVDALTASLNRLLADKGLRHRLGEAARSKVERAFSIDVVAPKIKEIYAQLGMSCHD
jgi:glycosyltransferase involved in cell wall biosynthesis